MDGHLADAHRIWWSMSEEPAAGEHLKSDVLLGIQGTAVSEEGLPPSHPGV